MKFAGIFNRISSTAKGLFKKFKGLGKGKKLIITAALVILIIIVFSVFAGKGKNTDEAKAYVEVAAERGSITETIEQSGVVEPLERYEITSLVKGEIISSPFEEGDMVEEGDTLYQIDDEDAQLNMEKAQMSLEEINEDVANLNIYAPASGKLVDFNIKAGEKIGAGIVGTIKNNEKLLFDVPFSSEDFSKISIGDKVTATSALYMTSIEGRVTYKYSANADIGAEGGLVQNIEIEIENPGALSDGTTFAATVHTKSGDVYSAGSGTIESGTSSSVRADVSGEVEYIAVKSGDYVKKGQLIARLKNNSLLNSQKNSQLSVRSNQKNLDDYNITSPISGTVITKNSKAGDKIDNTNSSKILMVVADMSKMKFTITVDELDIADIKLGQTAIVDADAIPDEEFEAKVTSISSEGVSSGDGVTTFSVELTIDEPGTLKSGMNVNATILINEATDVIVIPEDALMSTKGKNATVLVKKAEGKAAGDNKKTAKQAENSQKPTDSKSKDSFDGESGNTNENANRNTNENATENTGGNTRSNAGQTAGRTNTGGTRTLIPEGYEMRQVTVGISDGTNIEIVSGLSEGELVAYIPTSTSQGNMFTMMQGMPGGGMPGGGMQGGGMPGGGMPQGNRGR